MKKGNKEISTQRQKVILHHLTYLFLFMSCYEHWTTIYTYLIRYRFSKIEGCGSITLVVSLHFHEVTSLHPLPFRNDFSTCSTHFSVLGKIPIKIMMMLFIFSCVSVVKCSLASTQFSRAVSVEQNEPKSVIGI